MPNKKENHIEKLIQLLEARSFTVDHEPNEYINIARPDGVHCEFYGCGPNDEIFCATYTIGGEDTDLHLDVTTIQGRVNMVDIIDEILNGEDVENVG